MYNINYRENNPLLKSCKTLEGYAKLVHYQRLAKKQGARNSVDVAVQRCIREGILADYLKKNSKEVRNMLVAEYDYKTDIEVQREEAREEGMIEGGHRNALENARKLLLKSGLAEDVIADCCGLSLEEVKSLRARLDAEK